MKPVIAIVGRPNVGKSTLFNRIVGGRRAITSDLAGVTRDRHYAEASWDGRDFILLDTAGLILEAQGKLERKIQTQVDLALAEAETILFVVDGLSGLLPEEKTIATRLRKSGKRVLIVVNKIDHPSHQDRLHDFYPLGGDLLAVSAEHGVGVNDLLDQLVSKLEPAGRGEGVGPPIRVAILGRPNVGKSSLLNRLLGQERVVVHDEPGTTRDVVDTSLSVGDQALRLLDTAGIRRKGKWENQVERVSVLAALKTAVRADVCLIVLDAEEGLHKQDAHVAGFAFEAKKGVVLLWNKWDLADAPEEKYREEVLRKLKFLSFAPLLFISAKTGEGCSKIWPTVLNLHHASAQRVPTKQVNDLLARLLGAHNPPSFRGKSIKFSYATQVAVSPPTFVIFTNQPAGIPSSYERYLTHGFREAFDFGGAPIEIHFRKKD